MKKFLIVLPLVAIMGGCAMKYNTGVDIEGPGKRMFSNEVNYPSWYTENKKKDDSGIYAVASEYSQDFQFAVDKSTLSAKRELAGNFSSYVAAMMKDFATESGMTGSDVARADLERTTKMVISRVNLVGVERTQFKVVHEKNGYRAFVQLRYSEDQSNRILMNEIRRNNALAARFKSSKSFLELENEVNNIQQQRAEEIRLMTE